MKIIKEAIPYIIILAVVILIRTFVVTPVIVSGTSMNNTLKDGEILLLNKLDKKYERYDIVVFDYEDSKLVKRIIGLPGETVKYDDGKLYINGEETEDSFATITHNFELSEVIPEGYYFVMGDNRNNSSDSRIIGLISEEQINGTTTISLWPIKLVK